jgi:hypothetical protein
MYENMIFFLTISASLALVTTAAERHPVNRITASSSPVPSSPIPGVTMIPSDPFRAGSNLASVMLLRASQPQLEAAAMTEKEIKKDVISVTQQHEKGMRVVSGKKEKRNKRQIDAIRGSGIREDSESIRSSSRTRIRRSTRTTLTSSTTTTTAAAAALLAAPSASDNQSVHEPQSLSSSGSSASPKITNIFNDMSDDVRLKRDGKGMKRRMLFFFLLLLYSHPVFSIAGI